jgi:hypothetical protein
VEGSERLNLSFMDGHLQRQALFMAGRHFRSNFWPPAEQTLVGPHLVIS